jgi:hypothetical protein
MALTALGGQGTVGKIYAWIEDAHPHYKRHGPRYWKVCYREASLAESPL